MGDRHVRLRTDGSEEPEGPKGAIKATVECPPSQIEYKEWPEYIPL